MEGEGSLFGGKSILRRVTVFNLLYLLIVTFVISCPQSSVIAHYDHCKNEPVDYDLCILYTHTLCKSL